jgi:cell division protein FtsB
MIQLPSRVALPAVASVILVVIGFAFWFGSESAYIKTTVQEMTRAIERMERRIDRLEVRLGRAPAAYQTAVEPELRPAAAPQ